MKPERKRRLSRGLAVLLSASMILSTAGCGGGAQGAESSAETETSITQTSSQAPDQSSEGGSEALPSQEVQAPVTAKIDDQGKPIWDFDEFVNAEWKAENQGDESNTHTWELDDMIADQVKELLEQANLDEMSPEDDFYKVVTFYRQLSDESTYDQRIKTIKAHLAPIEKVGKLDDLYKLYRDEEYSIYNALLYYTIGADGYGQNMTWVDPMGLTDHGTLDEQAECMERLLGYFNKIGYDQAKAKKKVENALKVDLMINNFKKSVENVGYWYYIGQDQLDQEKVGIPVISILSDLGALPEIEMYLGLLEGMAFLRDLYQPENVEILRDFYYCTALSFLSRRTLTIMEEPDDAMALIMTYASDPLTKEYQKAYIADETIEDAKEMLEDIKKYERLVVADSEWLTIHGRELARRKILRITPFFGENGHLNELTEYVLTDNVVENVINLHKHNRNFSESQLADFYEDRSTFDGMMLQHNASYNAKLNSISIAIGYLSNPDCSKDAPYEVRLACLGETMAHEISHAYDPNGSYYDDTGYYDPWMKEEEMERYEERVQKIADFFDGMEVDYGEKLSGERVSAETFADLMAVEVCLRALAEREDADYDLFFRSYAKERASYYVKDDMDYIIGDTHLPGKERVNYILGQFDKFYEIYDIDENSPYFVPKEDRLPAF